MEVFIGVIQQLSVETIIIDTIGYNFSIYCTCRDCIDVSLLAVVKTSFMLNDDV